MFPLSSTGAEAIQGGRTTAGPGRGHEDLRRGFSARRGRGGTLRAPVGASRAVYGAESEGAIRSVRVWAHLSAQM